MDAESAKLLRNEETDRERNQIKGMKAFSELSKRFIGLDLQYRGDGSGAHWPKPWRAQIVTHKNERSEWREPAFGDTAEQAIRSLIKIVKRLDNP